MTTDRRWIPKWIPEGMEYQYKSTRKYEYYTKYNFCKGKRGKTYTEYEDNMIMASELPDKELAELMGRSVQSIHYRRSFIKRGRPHKEVPYDPNKVKNKVSLLREFEKLADELINMENIDGTDT